MVDGNEVFEELKRTDAYTTGATEEIKRGILVSFWRERAEDLKTKFGPEGLDGDNNGFGYLVEEFAKRSPRFPKNTAAAERIAGLILGILHTGDCSLVGIGHRMSNPDILFVECRGRLVKITGMAEVKSSFVAAQTKRSRKQIDSHEESIRKLVSRIENEKHLGTAHGFFKSRRLIVQEPLFKVVVLPAGQMSRLERDGHKIPEGWMCNELEFSYKELIFVAQKLWPHFREDLKCTSGELTLFEQKFLEPFFELWRHKIYYILHAKNGDKIPYRELFLFACATGRFPLSDGEIKFIETTAAGWQDDFLRHPESNEFIGESNLTAWEKRFLEIYRGLSNTRQAILFLTLLRSFAAKLEKHRLRIERMEPLDILEVPINVSAYR